MEPTIGLLERGEADDHPLSITPHPQWLGIGDIYLRGPPLPIRPNPHLLTPITLDQGE